MYNILCVIHIRWHSKIVSIILWCVKTTGGKLLGKSPNITVFLHRKGYNTFFSLLSIKCANGKQGTAGALAWASEPKFTDQKTPGQRALKTKNTGALHSWGSDFYFLWTDKTRHWTKRKIWRQIFFKVFVSKLINGAILGVNKFIFALALKTIDAQILFWSIF